MKNPAKALPALLLALCLPLLSACGILNFNKDPETRPAETSSSPASTERQASSTEPQATEAIFTLDELPRIDGSTANIPLGELLVRRVTGCGEVQAERKINFSKTTQAYQNLVYGSADFLLVYEGAPFENSENVELEKHVIGSDALVFLTGRQNPVESLTGQQIIDIYQGKALNWSQIGGQDAEIVAYQRNEGSGSQNLMEKLVMRDLPMMEAPQELYVAEMGGLISAVAEYQPGKASLGYSVYYYAQNMYQDPDVKLLSVDGVAPGNATIADGSYPYTNAFYAVIRADEPEGSPARRLLEWVLSEEGARCVTEAGYVSVTE